MRTDTIGPGPAANDSLHLLREAESDAVVHEAASQPAPVRAPRERHGTTHAARYWIRYDDATWTPVVDTLSGRLYEAWTAIGAGQLPRAAERLRWVGAALRQHALKATQYDDGATAAERKLAQLVSWRLASAALRAGMLATRIERGRVRSIAEARQIFDALTWLDLDRRWLVVGPGAWLPVCNSAQRHFMAAAGQLARLHRANAIEEVRKASGYLRLEAARVSGYARLALDAAQADLAWFTSRHPQLPPASPLPLQRQFGAALFALALGHRNRASQAWLRQDCTGAGYEFLAAGASLGFALRWQAQAPGPSSVQATLAADSSRALGRRLLAGEHVERSDVLRVVQDFSAAAGAYQSLAGKADALGMRPQAWH